ncbi:MAG: NYN domain-containing protein [Candidatus Longimicrobiales bacterium M2_2A_002]
MQNFVNAPHRGETPRSAATSPNAALLIDFDNVTMGIRSDLTTQLKELLNSDIIKGKVAVQRAYADWRRYAQYIVPLSEASVDLIFAPAYGSSKKNATDIRLAIDALELVFTRPEIGTYILLSGDSDFSSLVLKLKEYGKYVIGVGLRESASDLLVQNCDEYFSYSGLTGLTKAGEEDTVSEHDPWDLVEAAVKRMADQNDVMRSDRLKQVMLDLDPNFDEGEIGYSKFNKFLVEAASRNKLALKKLDNGQYEVQPMATNGGPAPRQETRREGRDRRDERARQSSSRSQPRSQPRERKEAAKPAPKPKTKERRGEDLDHAYDLLRKAVSNLITENDEPARDSDIKRQILEIEPGWDESELGFTKFSRFLRQAHDAEVIDLQRTSEGYYTAEFPGGPSVRKSEPAGGREEREERSGRDRRSERREPKAESTQVTAPARKEAPESEPAKAEAPEQPEPIEAEKEREQPESKAEATTPTEKAVEVAEETIEKAETPPKPTAEGPKEERKPASYGRGMRRGKTADGPPPLLPGQVVGGKGGPKQAESDQAEPEPEASPAPESKGPSEPEEPAEARPPAEPSTEPETTDREEDETPVRAPVAREFDPEELGLPIDEDAVIRYLSNSYQGVGQKTAEALIEEFGADGVFNGLNSAPERVKEILGAGRRTELLLEAWQRDYSRRTENAAGEKQPVG